ncbi:MAG: voltage-gated potassium channel [Blastocatellia bacterium]|jgi:voltage-gated potassium channel|nr:voltage-gated potassium channel [Blastocatellia bacterium]
MPFANRTRSIRGFKIRYALFALATAIVFGTVGFHLVEGWSLSDSLYVTVQTLTTVGYGDLPPRSGAGRLFAVLVMLIGAGGVALAISTIVQSVVKWELVSTFGQRRLTRKMSKLRDHYIICGSGRVGSHLVRDLLAANESFVVIESDQQRAAEFTQRGVNVLVGDATLEATLHSVGVEHARGLAACLPNDADNVYVVLTARDLSPNLRIVARAAEEQAEAKLLRAGANHVIAPTIIGGHRMAVALTKPAVSEFMDSITANELGLGFEQVEVDAASSLVGQELRSTPIRSDLDVVIISIRRQDGQVLFNPGGEATIENGDILIAIGRAESLIELNQLARNRM